MIKCGIRFLDNNNKDKVIKGWEYFDIDVDLNDDNYYLIDDAITEKIKSTDFSNFFNGSFNVEIDILGQIETRYFELDSKGLREVSCDLSDEIYEDSDDEGLLDDLT